MNKLKLCPFCNGEAKMQYGLPNRQDNRCKEVFVRCKVCNAKTKTVRQYPLQKWEDCKQMAILLWNRRVGNE